MKRWILLLATFALLALNAGIHGSPVTPVKAQPLTVPGMESRYFNLECKGNERASAIAIGNGRSYLGLYVYDSHGNCIAWDDEGMPQTRDDVAVEWHPPEKGIYAVEVRNSGFRNNECKVWLR